MIQIACNCDAWPTAHSHIPPKVRVRMHNGKEATVPREWLDLNQARMEILENVPGEIRPWVDWKQIAHDLMTDA